MRVRLLVMVVGAMVVAVSCRPVVVPLPNPNGNPPGWGRVICFNEPTRRHGHSVNHVECVYPAHPPHSS